MTCGDDGPAGTGDARPRRVAAEAVAADGTLRALCGIVVPVLDF
jgi:hypothetical protein